MPHLHTCIKNSYVNLILHSYTYMYKYDYAQSHTYYVYKLVYAELSSLYTRCKKGRLILKTWWGTWQEDYETIHATTAAVYRALRNRKRVFAPQLGHRINTKCSIIDVRLEARYTRNRTLGKTLPSCYSRQIFFSFYPLLCDSRANIVARNIDQKNTRAANDGKKRKKKKELLFASFERTKFVLGMYVYTVYIPTHTTKMK